jgi:hypothetical protein
MMMIGRNAAIGVVAISLCACGSPSPPPTAAAACSALAVQVCERAQACEPGILPLFGYATSADCVSGQADGCERALAAPHTGYTPALAQACGNALGAMNCTAFRSQTTAPACLPRGGKTAIGGSCNDGWQCASGHCNGSDPTRCGTCVAPVPLGQACTGMECANNLVCSASVCATPVGIGGDCHDDSVCPVDGHCDQTTHTCAKLPALGDACDSSVFFCDPTAASALCDSVASRCVGPVVVVQPGGDCSPTPTVCAGGICSFDADAGAGTCVGTVPVGGSCAPTDQCVFGSNCIDGTCQPPICDGRPADAGAAALVIASPSPSGRPGSVVGRSRREYKLSGLPR